MKQGFTLVEMVVSAAIIGLISSVLIFNHGKFNDNLELTNLAYEVALNLRQAQIYGVSVKEFKGGESEEERFGLAYGVHFALSRPTSFILFLDRNKDQRYTGNKDDCTLGSPDVCLERVNIGRGNYIYDVCEFIGGSEWACSLASGNPNGEYTEVSATFIRPDPDARLIFKTKPGPAGVKVCLRSPGGRIKEVVLYTTGQISVYDGLCEDTTVGDPGPGNTPTD